VQGHGLPSGFKESVTPDRQSQFPTHYFTTQDSCLTSDKIFNQDQVAKGDRSIRRAIGLITVNRLSLSGDYEAVPADGGRCPVDSSWSRKPISPTRTVPGTSTVSIVPCRFRYNDLRYQGAKHKLQQTTRCEPMPVRSTRSFGHSSRTSPAAADALLDCFGTQGVRGPVWKNVPTNRLCTIPRMHDPCNRGFWSDDQTKSFLITASN
jgi:hypothetical protein